MLPKEIPQNKSAEQSVLCSMLNEKAVALEVLGLLTAEDFYDAAHKVLFTAMAQLVNRGDGLDAVSLAEFLKQKEQLENVGGLSYILYLEHVTPTTAAFKQHVRIIKEASLKRQLLRLGQTLVANSVGEDDSLTQLETAQQSLNKIAEQKTSPQLCTLKELLGNYITEISALKPEESGFKGIPTCYDQLDSLTNGLNPSDFIVIAARPSMGKTALALNLVENILLNTAKPACHICFFSLEMSKKQLVSRLLAILTGIANTRLDSNRLDEGEWAELWQANDVLGSCGLYIDDTAGLTVTRLRTKAQKLQLEQGLDLIVIDYLQLMEGGHRHYQDRQQQIAEISRGLKALARELNIPVIALSQLSRNVEMRQCKRPILSDIRDSGSIEQDADLVIFLYRDDYYARESKEPGVTEMIIAKHRNGPTGVVKFLFEREYTKFIELV